MADKSTQLIVEALMRAAVAPGGSPLHAPKSGQGLFPASAGARLAAERARTEGLLAPLDAERFAITDKGRTFLAQQASPRQVLEDFLRVLEHRQSAVNELGRTVAEMAAELSAMKAAVERVLPRLNESPRNGHVMNGTLTQTRPNATAATDALIADIKARLAEWHAAGDSAHDCPLPELFRRLESREQASVGQFHDALRQLHDDHQIYLHPWTGPLYTLPEPAFALMVGHEVAFYASTR